MGNTLSSKLNNNAAILSQTGRNVKYGCILAFIFTQWKFRRFTQQIFYLPHKPDSKENKPNHMHILRTQLIYFIKIALFILSFSILFKKLIRMNYVSSSMDINLLSLPKQKYSISFMSFLLAYFIQQNANIFHWKWSLLLLIRSLYSLLRLNIPNTYKILSIEQINGIMWAGQSILAQTYASFMPSGLISTYNSVNPHNYNQKNNINMWCHHHKKMPPCTSANTFHIHKDEKNCFKAWIKDVLFINLPSTFVFFFKLHCVASMLNIKRFIKDLKSKPLKLLQNIFMDVIRSCGFWSIGAVGGVRFSSCFSKKCVKILHYILNARNKDNKKYEYIAEHNLYLNVLVSGIIGRYATLFETKGRRIEITLVMIWYSLLEIIRIKCNLLTKDNDKYHWLLGSKSFVSFLFSFAVAINIYVYCKDLTYLKTLERNVIHQFLVN